MYAIAAIGLLTIALSLMMIASPYGWSRGILAFEQKPYFHIAEIGSRIVWGGILVIFANQTRYPLFIQIVGGIFIFAGAFLIVAGEKRHREFAVKSATFTRLFRPAGFAGVAFGVFMVYTALA